MMLLSAGRPIGVNIPAGDDFVSWWMAAMSFLGLAHTFRYGEMIRVGLLIDLLGGRTRRMFEIAALLIGCGFIAFFAWYAVLIRTTAGTFMNARRASSRCQCGFRRSVTPRGSSSC